MMRKKNTISYEGFGRDCIISTEGATNKGNSQVKRPDPDETLESAVSPKRPIFQVKGQRH